MRPVTCPLPGQACLHSVCSELLQGSLFRKAKGKCILYSLPQADDNDIVLLELGLFVLETSAVDLQHKLCQLGEGLLKTCRT